MTISIFIIALLGVFFYKSQFLKEGWNKGFLCQDETRCLQGMTAVFVVLHHVAQHLAGHNIGLLYPFSLLGACFTGTFFFISGYGLIISLQTKKNIWMVSVGKLSLIHI